MPQDQWRETGRRHGAGPTSAEPRQDGRDPEHGKNHRAFIQAVPLARRARALRRRPAPDADGFQGFAELGALLADPVHRRLLAEADSFQCFIKIH